MPELLVDGTAMSGEMKGVGKYSHHVISLLGEMLGSDWCFTVLVTNKEFPPFSAENRINLVVVPLMSEMRKGLFFLPRFARDGNYDVLFTPMECIVGKTGVPRITVCHDINELMWEAQKQRFWSCRGLMNRAQQIVRIRSMRRCAMVACNSKFVRKEVIRRYGIRYDKTVIAYCGIDERFYEPLPLDEAARWHPFGDREGYMLTFATGDPRENYNLLPDILKSVREKQANCRMAVAGVFGDRDYSRKLVSEFLNRGFERDKDFTIVGFLGESQICELGQLYKQAEVYLELSKHEGFGMQLAEAMASGVWCVSSTGGALREVGSDYIIPLGEINVSSVSDSVCDCISLRNKSVLSTQVEYTKRFSWRATACQIGTAIKSIVPER